MIILTACGKSQDSDDQLGDIMVDKDSCYNVDANDEDLLIPEDRQAKGGAGDTEGNPSSLPADADKETIPPEKQNQEQRQRDTAPPKSELVLKIEKLKPEELYEWYKTNIADAWSDDPSYIKKKEEYYSYVAGKLAMDKEFADYVNSNKANSDFDMGFAYEINLKNAKDLQQQFQKEEEKKQQEKKTENIQPDTIKPEEPSSEIRKK